MTVKQYEAESMPDALSLIRRDLGERAVILQTRQMPAGFMRRRQWPEGLSWLGRLGRKGQVQVLAALDAPSDAGPETLPRETKATPSARRTAPVAAGEEHAPEAATRLQALGLPAEIAETLAAECGPNASHAALVAALARGLAIPTLPAALGQARIALVGPTGVGKTTTIAKLAARYALTEKKTVALITMDTYRIGAVEQLRTYARVLNVPMEVAHSPEEAGAATRLHADKDVILMDTVGRSPSQSMHLAELRAYLNAAEPTETHLVLSATCGPEYLARAARRFAALETNRLIMTKLDEMPAWGLLPRVVRDTNLPLAFIADGQEVPRDLRRAEPGEIAVRILGGAP